MTLKDHYIPATPKHGIDIASQRTDDLDCQALAFAKSCSPCQALDIGCGHGGQALRLVDIGAIVTASDLIDQTAIIAENANALGLLSPSFIQGDMRSVVAEFPDHHFDLVTCQRTLHYLPYADAMAVLKHFRRIIKPNGKLFISASGYHSPLNDGYPDHDKPIAQRFALLDLKRQQEHAIFERVCLYRESELSDMLSAAGFTVESIFTSTFGNIKAVARVDHVDRA